MGRDATRMLALAALSAALGLGCTDKRAAAKVDPAAVMQVKPAAACGEAADAGLEDTAMPAASGDELVTRMRHLLEAITEDEPELARDVLFPRDAYVASVDATDPPGAWDKKVSTPFRRAVSRTHKRTKRIEHASFVSFEIGHAIVQITPKKRGFNKPLWRVKHSKLTFTIDGKARHLDIAEMTAWRGAWYVTRLR